MFFEGLRPTSSCLFSSEISRKFYNFSKECPYGGFGIGKRLGVDGGCPTFLGNCIVVLGKVQFFELFSYAFAVSFLECCQDSLQESFGSAYRSIGLLLLLHYNNTKYQMRVESQIAISMDWMMSFRSGIVPKLIMFSYEFIELDSRRQDKIQNRVTG